MLASSKHTHFDIYILSAGVFSIVSSEIMASLNLEADGSNTKVTDIKHNLFCGRQYQRSGVVRNWGTKSYSPRTTTGRETGSPLPTGPP